MSAFLSQMSCYQKLAASEVGYETITENADICLGWTATLYVL